MDNESPQLPWKKLLVLHSSDAPPGDDDYIDNDTSAATVVNSKRGLAHSTVATEAKTALVKPFRANPHNALHAGKPWLPSDSLMPTSVPEMVTQPNVTHQAVNNLANAICSVAEPLVERIANQASAVPLPTDTTVSVPLNNVHPRVASMPNQAANFMPTYLPLSNSLPMQTVSVTPTIRPCNQFAIQATNVTSTNLPILNHLPVQSASILPVNLPVGNQYPIQAAGVAFTNLPGSSQYSIPAAGIAPTNRPSSSHFPMQAAGIALTNLPASSGYPMQAAGVAPTNLPASSHFPMQAAGVAPTNLPASSRYPMQAAGVAPTNLPASSHFPMQAAGIASTNLPASSHFPIQAAGIAPTNLATSNQLPIQAVSATPMITSARNPTPIQNASCTSTNMPPKNTFHTRSSITPTNTPRNPSPVEAVGIVSKNILTGTPPRFVAPSTISCTTKSRPIVTVPPKSTGTDYRPTSTSAKQASYFGGIAPQSLKKTNIRMKNSQSQKIKINLLAATRKPPEKTTSKSSAACGLVQYPSSPESWSSVEEIESSVKKSNNLKETGKKIDSSNKSNSTSKQGILKKKFHFISPEEVHCTASDEELEKRLKTAQVNSDKLSAGGKSSIKAQEESFITETKSYFKKDVEYVNIVKKRTSGDAIEDGNIHCSNPTKYSRFSSDSVPKTKSSTFQDILFGYNDDSEAQAEKLKLLSRYEEYAKLNRWDGNDSPKIEVRTDGKTSQQESVGAAMARKISQQKTVVVHKDRQPNQQEVRTAWGASQQQRFSEGTSHLKDLPSEQAEDPLGGDYLLHFLKERMKVLQKERQLEPSKDSDTDSSDTERKSKKRKKKKKKHKKRRKRSSSDDDSDQSNDLNAFIKKQLMMQRREL